MEDCTIPKLEKQESPEGIAIPKPDEHRAIRNRAIRNRAIRTRAIRKHRAIGNRAVRNHRAIGKPEKPKKKIVWFDGRPIDLERLYRGCNFIDDERLLHRRLDRVEEGLKIAEANLLYVEEEVEKEFSSGYTSEFLMRYRKAFGYDGPQPIMASAATGHK